MYNRYSSLVLRWLKVPPEPHPPFGDPASLRVFRAGKNYYKLRMFGWGVAEFFAFLGILFWALVFVHVEETARYEKARRTATAQVVAGHQATLAEQARQTADSLKAASETALQNMKGEGEKPATAGTKPGKRRARSGGGWNGFISGLVEIAVHLPAWAFPLLWVLKLVGFAAYLLQLPLTYAIRRLDFEMRWYVVTDRSLRIRTGVWSVQESTMSFANLQQVEVSQGPLQRLLGLADVKVQSAGGSDNPHGKPQDDLHTGHFHGVDNAHEIRDLIQDRLRRFRESGLGDPEEARQAALAAATPQHAAVVTPTSGADDADVLIAARELTAEAKALRVALG
jgi:membrane protein YdbS with pleckstrin-like domain